MESFGQFIFGLGLFFTGLAQLVSNLKQLGSHQFRILVSRYAHPRWKAWLFGLVSGAVMQSSPAVLMILSSLTATSLITVTEALPIIAAFNVGRCVLVFLAVIDIQFIAAFIVGVAAIALHFSQKDAGRRLFGLVMGLGLIFYGVSAMEHGATPLQNEPWFNGLMTHAHNYPMFLVLIGALLGFITQSSNVVAMIGISFVAAKLLELPQALMLIYGAAIGSSMFKALLGASFTGSARQLMRYQNVFNLVGAVIFIAMFYVETLMHVPLLMALLPRISDSVLTQVALAFLLFNLVSALVLTAVQRPIANWLEKCLPKSAEEELSAPKYISMLPPEDATTALDLIRREQLRELVQITGFFSTLRESATGPNLDRRVEAVRRLGKEVDHAAQAVMKLSLREHEALLLTYVQSRQTVIMELAEVVNEMAGVILQAREHAPLHALADHTLEALDFLLISAAEDLDSADAEVRRTLRELCADRGPMMEKWRKAFLQQEIGLSLADRSLVLSLTTGLEKCVWLLRRLVTTDDDEKNSSPETPSAAAETGGKKELTGVQ